MRSDLDLLKQLIHAGVPLLQVDPLDGAPLVPRGAQGRLGEG